MNDDIYLDESRGWGVHCHYPGLCALGMGRF